MKAYAGHEVCDKPPSSFGLFGVLLVHVVQPDESEVSSEADRKVIADVEVEPHMDLRVERVDVILEGRTLAVRRDLPIGPEERVTEADADEGDDEPNRNPELKLETGRMSIEECVDAVVNMIEDCGII